MYLSACIYARFFSFLLSDLLFPINTLVPFFINVEYAIAGPQQPIMVINDAIFTTQYKNMLSLDAPPPISIIPRVVVSNSINSVYEPYYASAAQPIWKLSLAIPIVH